MNKPNKLECYITLGLGLSSDEHSSLLGAFVNYEENEVLWLQPLGPYSQYSIFFMTYD